MKIKMTTCSASPDGVHGIGSIRDVSESKAVELVSGGFAKYVGSVEDATTKSVPVDEMGHKELVAACKAAGLPTAGGKKKLLARLKDNEQPDDDQPAIDEDTSLDAQENAATR